MSTPLFVGPDEKAALAQLREKAAADPVDVSDLNERLKDPVEELRHRDRMNALSVRLPFAYFVTFSIETGHPAGIARHMSMSVGREGRVPTPEAVWMIAEMLGFVGGLERCELVWMEKLRDGGDAVNLVQLLTSSAGKVS
jgi:hypothetical protein